jgi:NAD(P)-dependent dehydrogenase (short-subunit alcohol dehydrogenase family)
MLASMHALRGRVAIVSGASSGIGHAAAALFAEEGAKVVVTARRAGELDALVARIRKAGGEAVAVPGDVRDETHAARLVRTACEQFGGLDLAFNNAGTLVALAPVHQLSAQDWRETLDTNLTSAFLAARTQIPAMLERGGGSLLFTSTFVGHTVGFPNLGAYAAAKAGLIGLVRTVAAELGPRGIRANALLPGGVDTPMGRVVASSPEAQAFIASLHALKRLATPLEIARTALHLLSDAASFTTGAAVFVDGGVSILRA